MKAGDLIKFGIPDKIVRAIKAGGTEYLLPLQTQAINTYGLLNFHDLLVNGPTSSGKSYCGELAVLRSCAAAKKGVILVPYKALASEKFNSLNSAYSKAGLKSLIVTADYQRNKPKFKKGEYDLAVMTYEMFNNMLADRPSLLDNIGTVVLDELQLIAERERGLQIELALSVLRDHNTKTQKVGLIGGIDDCRELAEWLGWSYLNFTNRPVDLFCGTLMLGTFNYQSYNSCNEGIEYIVPKETIELDDQYGDGCFDFVNAVIGLLEKGEQALGFVQSREASRKLAKLIAEYRGKYEHSDSFIEMENLPETNQKAELLNCLNKGVAFHNADLCRTSRELIESRFRAGALDVIIATPTLMYGVNLPSRNVILVDKMYKSDARGYTSLRPLKQAEFQQACGRAGRWGQVDDYGRAMVIVSSSDHKEQIWQHYINVSSVLELESLTREDYAFLILRLINQGLVRDREDAQFYLNKTYRHTSIFGELKAESIIDFLSTYEFARIKGCGIACSDFGQAVCKHNVDLDTAARIKKAFTVKRLESSRLSWLFELSTIVRSGYIRASGEITNLQISRIIDQVNSRLALFGESPVGKLKDFMEKGELNIDTNELMTFLLLADVPGRMSMAELEMTYNIGWGRIRSLGSEYANMFRAIVEIGRSLGFARSEMAGLGIMADCLNYCIAEEGLELAKLNIESLERDFLMQLNSIGIDSPSDVFNRGYGALLTVLPKAVASALYREAEMVMQEAADETILDGKTSSDDYKVRFDGKRYRLKYGETEVRLQPKLFSYFRKLYYNQSRDGWLDKSLLDPGFNQVKYIYKLKKAIEPIKELALESDRSGKYRLVKEA